MRFLIDTNIFLEVLLEQGKVEEAKTLLLKTKEYDFFMSDFSLHSIGLLLFYQKQHNIFQQFLKDMIFNAGMRITSLSVNDMETVIESAKRFKLDFDDAYQYVIAEKYGLAIISFDSDFDRTERGRTTPGIALKK